MMKDTRKVILLRVYVVYFLMLLFGLLIIGKAIKIQFIEGEKWKKKATEFTLKVANIKAVRGNICALDGSLLATSVPIFDIRMDVASEHISDNFLFKNIDSLSYCLSHLFKNKSSGQYKSDLLKARADGNRFFPVKRNVTYSQLKKLRKFPIFRKGKYRGGLIIISKTHRELPFKMLAARTIGYERNNYSVGLEGKYNDVLTGYSGQRLMQRIGNGVWMPLSDANEIEPRNGQDIITTIDINIQDVTEHALLKHLQVHKADHGCAILMEVKSGHIKAIANLCLDKKNGVYKESYNYAIGESIEPGSTFKLASVMALLENNYARLEDSIKTGNGTVYYHNSKMADSHPLEETSITLRTAFEKSSNVGISKKIVEAFTKREEKFVDCLNNMTLNDPLGLDISGEGMPFIKSTDDKSWSKITLPWMSIGYEVKLTPMQILAFYNAIANGGKKVKPMFVKEIRKAGKTINTFETEVLKESICSKNTLEKAKDILEGVVERGTGKSLNNSAYKIAGKTGTAQIAKGNLGYDKYNYNASFVGYFPAENPKYSCIVVISKPSTGLYYASSVAAPVFKEIANKVYSTQLDIQQKDITINSDNSIPLAKTGNQADLLTVYRSLNLPVIITDSIDEWAVTLPEENNVVIRTRRITENIVPNVKGMGAKDAVYILEKIGLKVRLNGKGIIIKQSISPGSNISVGKEIVLELST
ncbi:MAG: PASTA domain-containing protein [Bacteroidales bacterium]|nr:PASTA domain-containing protein [Bacteroidales bacterium]